VAVHVAGEFVATTPLNRAPVDPILRDLMAPNGELSHHNTVRARMNLLSGRPTSEDIVPELAATLKACFPATLNEKGAASAPRVAAVVITAGGDAFAGVLTIGLTAASLD